MFPWVQQAKQRDQRELESSVLQLWFNPGLLATNPDVESQITGGLRKNDPASFLESCELTWG